MIDVRRKAYRFLNEQSKLLKVVGSKADGLTAEYESDKDCLMISNEIIAREAGTDIKPPFIPVCDMVTEFTEPGHVMLALHKKAFFCDNPYADESLYILIAGTKYLSSGLCKQRSFKIMIEASHDYNEVEVGIAGPSINVGTKFHSCDSVVAIRGICPNVLKSWAERDRVNDWPSRDVKEEILQTEVQLVPTGINGSLYEHCEWRLCFIPAEQILTSNLNETLIKAYVVLKMIAKHILKSVCVGVSSFMLKNIIYWVAEMFPQGIFTKSFLYNTVSIGLQILLKCVHEEDSLPYYMIPDRNLLSGKVLSGDRQRLSTVLQNLILFKQQFVHKIPKLHYTLIGLVTFMPDPQRNQRDILNTLLLAKKASMTYFENLGLSKEETQKQMDKDELYQLIVYHLANIVIPEWTSFKDISKSMEVFSERFSQRMYNIDV
ncbi:uncharacterized protein LOC127837530 isoform X2 [Dreissena polymorpha]|nr:uncharacterized protein LOC127837530 isoform X2 [Dreissena polymorpha]